MRRRRALGALAIAVLGASMAPEAMAHEGNPNFESLIKGISPDAHGVEVEVLNFDDSLRLRNSGDQTVVIEGYGGEPYVRINADGTVEVNTRSPAYHLNRDRYAQTDVPASADATAAPDWQEVDDSGQFSWHDHRAHYMGTGTPPQVGDESQRTKVFDYRVPLMVAGEPAAIMGALYWRGSDDGFPLAPFMALAGVVVLGGTLLVLRRQRTPDRKDEEAW